MEIDKIIDERIEVNMLKIKDNVDLKELEKFGFQYNSYNNSYEKELGDAFYYILKINRLIRVVLYNEGEMIFDDTIYDLIQAELVEKV